MKMEPTIKLTHQSFEWSRFKAYFGSYYFANSRKLMLSAASILIAWLLICILPNVLSEFEIYKDNARLALEYPEKYYAFVDPYLSTEQMIGAFFLAILATLAGSSMFTCMHGKGNRQTLLAMPASSLEKYLTYFAIYILGSIAVFFVSEIIADALRVAIVKMFSDYGEYAHFMSLKGVFTFGIDIDLLDSTIIGEPVPVKNYLFITSYYSFVLITAAIFSLGSIVWQKASYLKTLCALAILQVVMSCLFILSLRVFFGWNSNIDPIDIFSPTGPLAQSPFIILIGLAISFFMFWLGYRRFKDTDLVERW